MPDRHWYRRIPLNPAYPRPVVLLCMLASWTAIGLLLAGLYLPLLELQKFWIFSNRVSMLGGIHTLWAEGESLLGVVIAVFAVVFPLAKLALALCLLHGVPRLRRWEVRLLGLLSVLGKWSMLDVFIVAILVTTVKLGGIASVHTGPGLYCFLGSVLLAQLTGLLMSSSRQPDPGVAPDQAR